MHQEEKRKRELECSMDPIWRLGRWQWLGKRGSEHLPKPRVTIKVERNLVDFLVDTKVQSSIITKSKGKLSQKTRWVQGATKIWMYKDFRWTTNSKLDLSSGQVIHSFMVISECPWFLLGWDILTNTSDCEEYPLQYFPLSLAEEHQLHAPHRDPPPPTHTHTALSQDP